ncbi:MAG: MotA/TolQ/ExbB proton channel family protein [Bdellovibrionaceae bacterium]|nr:MotA/TolQ/ExbB proton channel family protein [Pseudobdellovibrionaceae bacterium]
MNTEQMGFIQRAFVEGGPVMYIILFIGIVTILLIFERLIALKAAAVDKKDFLDQVYSMILRGDVRGAISFCDVKKTPLSNTIKAGLVQALNKRPDEEIQVAMDASVLREQPKIEGWASLLAVTGNAAVLSGLLGTIIGMIQSFRAVAAADPAQKAEELSKGISHALNCTAFGLLVAIISIIAYGYLQLRIQRLENEMVEGSMSVLNLVAANRDKIRD